MNLFAITKKAGARILRFPLTGELQENINTELTRQKDAFLNGVTATVAFDGRYKPDPDELLEITPFLDVDGLLGAVQNPMSVDLYEARQHSLADIKGIFASIMQDEVLIQFFERRRLISNKGLAMFFSGDTFRQLSDEGLTLDNKLLAILTPDALRFQSFHYLKQVFELEDYFKEATNAELASFAQHEKLMVGDIATFQASASATIRRKVGLIIQSGVLESYTVEQIVASAQLLKIDISTSEGKIILPSNSADLKKLLRFLDEDYYESALSQKRYLSNSKRVAD